MEMLFDESTRESMWRFMMELFYLAHHDEDVLAGLINTTMTTFRITDNDKILSLGYELIDSICYLSITSQPQRNRILQFVDDAIEMIASPSPRQSGLVHMLKIACMGGDIRPEYKSFSNQYSVYDIALTRFLHPQRKQFEEALTELKQGKKAGHWIWFIFPQLRGLGRSWESEYYGITRLEEAQAYLEEPVLGARLREVTEAVLSHPDLPAETIMGSELDALKLCSSMTLFDAASPGDIFGQVLDTFYDGQRDTVTLPRLKWRTESMA